MGNAAGVAVDNVVDAAVVQPIKAVLQPSRHLESVHGAAGFFDPHKVINASACVCRIRTSGGYYGTGTLIDGSLFGFPTYCVLTNSHVLDSLSAATGAAAIFYYETNTLPADYIHVQLRPALGFCQHRDADLDYAICACQPAAASKLARKMTPVSLASVSTTPLPTVHTPLTIIQHPQGGFKQVSQWTLKSINSHSMTYTNDTQPGSSGSMVWNNMYEPVGLHYAGGSSNNFGCILASVVKHILRHQRQNQPSGARACSTAHTSVASPATASAPFDFFGGAKQALGVTLGVAAVGVQVAAAGAQMLAKANAAAAPSSGYTSAPASAPNHSARRGTRRIGGTQQRPAASARKCEGCSFAAHPNFHFHRPWVDAQKSQYGDAAFARHCCHQCLVSGGRGHGGFCQRLSAAG